MAQVSTASAAPVDDDEIGARIARLGLPARPMIMGKTSSLTNCLHEGICFCNIYTTLLDRGPDQPLLAESPEPESRREFEKGLHPATPVSGSSRPAATSLTNGSSKGIQPKKLSLSQYNSKKAAGSGTGSRGANSPATGEKR